MSVPVDELRDAKGRLPALPSLTGLRFVAAFAVFLLHSIMFVQIFPFMGSDAWKKMGDIFPMQLGATGVAFFFILSGFIIDWSYDGAKDTIRGFLRRRVFKIMPSHLITALAVFVILGFPLAKLVSQIPNFLLIQTWTTDWSLSAELNGPSWSLCSEMLFYFLFPFVIPVVNRIRGKAIWWAIGIITVILFAIHLVIHYAYPGFDLSGMGSMYPPMQKSPDITWSGVDYSAAMSPSGGMPASGGMPQSGGMPPMSGDMPQSGGMPPMSGDMPQSGMPPVSGADAPAMPASGSGSEMSTVMMPTGLWLSYQFPATRLLEFFVGVLFCRLVKSGMWRNTNLVWPALAVAGAYALTYYVPLEFKTSFVMMLPLAALIATYAVRDLQGRKGVFSSRVGVWLGDVSFAFYMVGYPVQVFLQRTVIRDHSWDFRGYVFITVLTLAIQLPLAAALYFFVDKPIMARWARKKPKPATELTDRKAEEKEITELTEKEPTLS